MCEQSLVENKIETVWFIGGIMDDCFYFLFFLFSKCVLFAIRKKVSSMIHQKTTEDPIRSGGLWQAEPRVGRLGCCGASGW